MLGVHPVSYGAWEKGKYKPPTEVFPKLAEFFGFSRLWLARGIPTIPMILTANANEKPTKKESNG